MGMRDGMTLRSSSTRVGVPLAGAAALLALAGCGGASSPKATSATTALGAARTTTTAGGATSVPATTAPAPPPTTAAPAATTVAPTPASTPASGPRPCATSQLSLALSGASGAAGSTYITLDLRNTSAAACTLTGYPGVSYVAGSSGAQVGAAATRDTSSPVTTVTVGAGQTARSQLRLVNPYDFDPSTCKIVDISGFRVYPPGQTTAAFVADSGKACSGTLPQPALFVGAVHAG